VFSRSIKHTHYSAPRSLEQAFGHGARLTVLEERSATRNAAETLGYIVAGLILGAVISYAMVHGYRWICGVMG